jgi:hypothetical protein
MNDLTNPNSSTPDATVESLERQLQSLRKLFVIALTILLVISGSVMIFLWGQKRILNSQLRDARKFVDDYEKTTAPFLGNFVNNLNAYAKTHPDLNPILDKYNLRPAASNVPPPVAAPAPKTPAPKATKK